MKPVDRGRSLEEAIVGPPVFVQGAQASLALGSAPSSSCAKTSAELLHNWRTSPARRRFLALRIKELSHFLPEKGQEPIPQIRRARLSAMEFIRTRGAEGEEQGSHQVNGLEAEDGRPRVHDVQQLAARHSCEGDWESGRTLPSLHRQDFFSAGES
eukprot:765821-Hanusia_phi.AAC.2